MTDKERIEQLEIQVNELLDLVADLATQLYMQMGEKGFEEWRTNREQQKVSK